MTRKKEMKKSYLFLLLVLIACLSSCRSARSTATYQDPINTLRTVTVADLDVSETRITYTYKPTYAVRLGGNLWGTERKVHWRFWESVVNEHVI